MPLDICGSERIEQPTEQQIKQAVRGLTGQGDSFVLLDVPGRSGFLMADGGPERFHVEYAEIDEAAGRQRQFGTGDVPADRLIAAMVDYLHGGEAYRELGPWEPVLDEALPGRRTDVLKVPQGKMPGRGCALAMSAVFWVLLIGFLVSAVAVSWLWLWQR